MSEAKPFPSPMVTIMDASLSAYQGSLMDDLSQYMSIFGDFQYVTFPRLDIAFAII